MKKRIVACALLCVTGFAHAAPVDTAKISVRLAPEKAEYMLGEPGYVAFVVHNESADKLGLIVGGDYRNALGRPNSFKVEVRDAKGQLVPQPSAGFDMGGLSGPQDLPPHGDYAYSLFLPHWATFAAPGTYTMRCRRTLPLIAAGTPVEDWFKNATDFPVEAQTKIKILPRDDAKMGALIARWGKAMLSANDAESEAASQNLRAMQDERVVPYFVRAAREGNYGLKFAALLALPKYDSDTALEGIKLCTKATGRQFSGEATRPDLADGLAKNIRHAAAGALSDSRHPQALSLLLDMRHDAYYGVRLTVVHKLGTLRTPQARQLLEEMTHDANEAVSGEAQRYLTERKTAPDARITP